MTRASNANHKAKCQKYKTSGRREENKRLRQERYERKMEKMALRRREKEEQGEKKEEKTKRSGRRKKQEYTPTPPYSNKLPIQKWTSIMRKLDNELEEKKRADKAKATNNNYPKHHKHDDIDSEM